METFRNFLLKSLALFFLLQTPVISIGNKTIKYNLQDSSLSLLTTAKAQPTSKHEIRIWRNGYNLAEGSIIKIKMSSTQGQPKQTTCMATKHTHTHKTEN